MGNDYCPKNGHGNAKIMIRQAILQQFQATHFLIVYGAYSNTKFLCYFLWLEALFEGHPDDVAALFRQCVHYCIKLSYHFGTNY